MGYYILVCLLRQRTFAKVAGDIGIEPILIRSERIVRVPLHQSPIILVEPTGFEPVTFSMPLRRSTK